MNKIFPSAAKAIEGVIRDGQLLAVADHALDGLGCGRKYLVHGEGLLNKNPGVKPNPRDTGKPGVWGAGMSLRYYLMHYVVLRKG